MGPAFSAVDGGSRGPIALRVDCGQSRAGARELPVPCGRRHSKRGSVNFSADAEVSLVEQVSAETRWLASSPEDQWCPPVASTVATTCARLTTCQALRKMTAHALALHAPTKGVC